MDLTKLGQSLFSLGGSLLMLGFIILKFPNILRNLPSISLENKVVIPIGSIIAITVIFSILSLLFGYLAKFIK